MANILKRQKIRVTIDGLDIKNPSVGQKEELKKMIEENSRITETGEILVAENNRENEKAILKYMITELVDGLELTEEEVDEAIDDPSLTLRKINTEFNAIVSEINQESLTNLVSSVQETQLLAKVNADLDTIGRLIDSAAKENEKMKAPVKKKRKPKAVK